MIYLELVPFLSGYMVFFFLWMFYGYTFIDALGPASIVWALAYLLYFRWKDRIRAEAQTQDAINMMIRWTEGVHLPFTNVIEEITILEEPSVEDVAKASEDGTLATLVYKCEARFTSPCKNIITGDEFKSAIFVHHGPKDRTFGRVPGQWVTHKGLMMFSPASVLDVDFMGHKNELDHKPVFHVKASPYSTRLNQIGVGLTPETASHKSISDALSISSIREAMPLLLKNRQLESENIDLKQDERDGILLGHKTTNRLLRDVDLITRKGVPLTARLRGRIREIALGAGVLILLYLVATYFGWL